MRIALISDIHGNEQALDAVLDDIDGVGVDQIVCLGDVATLGPHPSTVIHKLMDLDCPCIMGNHDEFLLEPKLIHEYIDIQFIKDSVEWCRKTLSDSELDYLRTFESMINIVMNDKTTLTLFHGTPGSNMEDLLSTTPPGDLDKMIKGFESDVMAGGHTHIQMLRQHNGNLIVNPGSTGFPFMASADKNLVKVMQHAEYAVVEAGNSSISVTFHQVPIDISLLRKDLKASENPLSGSLLKQYE